MLLDTGLRIAEALALRVEDVDLENCLIDVKLGKGGKHRKVPITQNGRTRLYLHLRQANPSDFVFPTSTGTALSIRNAQHDIKALCMRAGITGVRTSPHTFRHSMGLPFLEIGWQPRIPPSNPGSQLNFDYTGLSSFNIA